MKRIIEAGHYYQVKGPTVWSKIGWEIGRKIVRKDDCKLLFIDDVHTWQNVPGDEKNLPVVEFKPEADFLVLESEILSEAFEVLEILKSLPRKSRARSNNGMWFCSGTRLTNESGTPLCVLLDAGLTLHKNRLGFVEGVNILPFYYKQEQQILLRLIRKARPDFRLSVILYDLNGDFWPMPMDE